MQARLDGQSRYPTLWPSFVELGQSQSAQFPAIIQDPKREVLHLYYTDHTHTHARTHAHTQTFKEERDVLDLGLKYNYYVKALEKIACSDRPQKKS